MHTFVDVAQVVTAIAAVIGIGLAIYFSNANLRQNYNLVGAQTGLQYREHVIDLLSKGLTPDQIRAMLALETGGDTYEKGYGSIDQIARLLHRR